ncbi:hypothetical protein CGCSCA1_v011470 [Colletotrichum siamense]|nr:hypothetical protein CGCSCA1_v011470 [Colletotrichum siamense]
MPEASVDPGYGSLRRKVTLACDYCRKKREPQSPRTAATSQQQPAFPDLPDCARALETF